MALVDSFFIPDYVQMDSGLTSPSELLSEVIVVVDLSSSPVSVSFPTGSIILNGTDVGTSASVSEGDTFQLKVTNPTVGQESIYQFTVAGIVQMEWRVTLYDTSTLPSETVPSSTDSDSFSQTVETIPTVIVQVAVPEEETTEFVSSQETQPENETTETVSSLEQVSNVIASIKADLQQSIEQAVTNVAAESESDVVSEKDIADLFDNETRIEELTEVLSTQKLAEIVEETLVDENVKQLILTDDKLKEFTRALPEQVVDEIVVTLKETVINEIVDLVETKEKELTEIVETATVKVLEPFIDTDVITVIEKLVVEDTETVDLSNLEKSELSEVESIFGQFFFENLETDAVNEINISELTVREFLLDNNIGNFVETVLANDISLTEEEVRDEIRRQALEFLTEKENLLDQTFVVPAAIDELKRLDLVSDDLIDEFNRLETGEQTELLQTILREFETSDLNLGQEEQTDDAVTAQVGEEDTVDDAVTVQLGQEGVDDEAVETVIGQDDIDDETTAPVIGTDDVDEEAIETVVGQDDVDEESTIGVIGTDDIDDEAVAPSVGQDDIDDSTITTAVGEDTQEDETVTQVAGEEELGETSGGDANQLIGSGLPKGVIRLRDGILTFYHLRPITILGEITGLNSTIGPFIDRNGINRNMKL